MKSETAAKNIRRALTAAASTAILMLCGCASIITSGDHRIPISSNPSEAKVTIYDMRKMVVATGTTPIEFKLKKGSGYFQGADYRMVVEKPGFQTREFQITHKINGWYFGNFFLGGALGLLVVDPLTGAMWTLEPNAIDVQLTPATANIDGTKVSVVSLAQLSKEQRSHLLPVPRAIN